MNAKLIPNGKRNRARKDFIKTLEGFPRITDWSRFDNDRLTTLALNLFPGLSVYYSYDLPVAFTNGSVLCVLGLEPNSPFRTRTTMRHINTLCKLWPNWAVYDPESFVHQFNELLRHAVSE